MIAALDNSLAIVLALVALAGVLLSSVIGAGAALLGGWLASRRDKQREEINRDWQRERWRTDQRVIAYGDVIKASDDFRKLAGQLYDSPESDPDHMAIARELDSQTHLLDRAASRASLVGSAAILPSLTKLVTQAFVKMVEGINEEVAQDRWKEICGTFYELYDRFIDAARSDLGMEPFPPSSEPKV